MFIEKDDKLQAELKFKDFQEAFAFMTEVAICAERADHHPWWSNVYDTVEIHLNTHDAGNVVTQKDRDLAGEIEKLYQKYKK